MLGGFRGGSCDKCVTPSPLSIPQRGRSLTLEIWKPKSGSEYLQVFLLKIIWGMITKKNKKTDLRSWWVQYFENLNTIKGTFFTCFMKSMKIKVTLCRILGVFLITSHLLFHCWWWKGFPGCSCPVWSLSNPHLQLGYEDWLGPAFP